MGTKVTIDEHLAKKVLLQSFKQAQQGVATNCGFELFIEQIITGKHLTFRYILFTALLAKATVDEANPLCLQAGSSLDGAFDARSLCHHVIVPFEKESLDKILGGSNEPFLNKPARFPELNPSNPVRKGNDQRLLNLLCDTLPKINSSAIAQECLVFFLEKALHLIEERDSRKNHYLAEEKADRLALSKFFHSLLNESHEGESLTLVVANVYNLLFANNKDITVEVHPVNQCGASSKEVSDLDVKENGVLVISNELKDRNFSETDIEHAVDKVLQNGGDQMYFIIGRHADYSGASLDLIVEKYQARNVLVNIVDIDTFLDIIYPLCCDASLSTVIEYSAEIIKNTKFKRETEEYFYAVIDDLKQTN